MTHQIMVEMKGITKRFPGVIANENVNLEIKAGEIHALLGENGAGKSTLMSILTGLYKADDGDIFIKGKISNFKSPKDAIDQGIGMVHQHFRLVGPLTVADNVILGSKKIPFWLNKKKIKTEILELSQKYGLAIDPDAKVWQLSVGEQQRVEIVKMLFRGSDILILDEPTAVLTPQESRDLFTTLRRMADNGKAVIVITHKMQEVMEMSDRVTVLRGGKSVATMATSETSKEDLTKLMVGRDVLVESARKSSQPGDTIISLENVRALNDKGLPGLRDINLEIRSGEIVGVAGVAGNGQRELAEVISGLRDATGGQILVGNKDFTHMSPRKFIEAGVSLIPEDRLGTGLIPNLGIMENVLLKKYRQMDSFFINYSPVKAESAQMVKDFEVKVGDFNAPVKLMSGGNLQKLLLAREVSTNPHLIVAVYPVRGLDIGATEAVRSLLLSQKAQGKGVLLISEDLDEIMRLSDRIVVLFEGEIMGEVSSVQATREEIGSMMTGTKTSREVKAS